MAWSPNTTSLKWSEQNVYVHVQNVYVQNVYVYV